MQELGENSLSQAREASQLIEQRNIGEAKSALVKAAMGVAKHIHEITKLIERYTAVQDFYMREEDSLTQKIFSHEKKMHNHRSHQQNPTFLYKGMNSLDMKEILSLLETG